MPLRTPPAQRRIARTTPPEDPGLYLFLALAADINGLSRWRLDRIQLPAMLRTPCLVGRSEATHRVGPDRLSPVAKRCAPDGCYQVLSGDPPAAAVGARTQRSICPESFSDWRRNQLHRHAPIRETLCLDVDAMSPSFKSALNLKSAARFVNQCNA